MKIICLLFVFIALFSCSDNILYFTESTPEETTEKPKKLSEDYLANQNRGFLFNFVAGIENGVNEDNVSRMAQMLGMLGREDLTNSLLPRNKNLPECGSSLGDPVAEIVKQARKTSIVIINEAHHQPRDRDFIRQAVQALYGAGYHIYAAETFNFAFRGKPDPKLPILHEGFYSSEPIFGRLIREVKALEFELVAYEQKPEQNISQDLPMVENIKNREAAQTENLMAAIFTERSDAKVVIHVGFRHAAEDPIRVQDEYIPWMAARLKAATGIDPLTISLTDCYASDDEIVLSTATKDGQIGKTSTDLMVGMPLYSFTNNRPDWRRKAGDIDVAIPEQFLGQSELVIVEARRLGDTVITVPEDRVLLLPGDVIPLLLPSGQYQVEAWTKGGKFSEKPVILTVSQN